MECSSGLRANDTDYPLAIRWHFQNIPVMTQDLPSPSDTMIPWRRFWSSDASPIHQEDGGLLVHYDPRFGGASFSDLVQLEDLIRGTSPLLFLLGDPGMGKTTELKEAQRLIDEHSGPEDYLVEVDIRSIGNFDKFIARKSNSEAWQKWLSGTGKMILVIDGLDEGIVLVTDLLVDLKNFLKDQKTDRIRLILSTRFFDHVRDKAKELWALWKTPADSPLPVYTLCPLRREEVKEAATHYGCDPAAFFDAVLERNVTGFAARPVTLFFLLRQFVQEDTLSSTRQEIYEKGVSALLDEADEKRSSALVDATPRLGFTRPEAPLKDRLEAASNLAAQLLLSGSAGIWEPMGVAFEECPEGNLSLDEMTDSSPGSPMARRTLIEIVHSALFKSVGVHRYEFAHPTFAEYLAAKRLARMPLVQLKSLLCHRDIRGEYIIPQLGDLAAWLTIFHQEFRELMLATDPQMLLRGEVRTFPADLKMQLVEKLLEGMQELEVENDHAQERYFSGLNHPDLAEQLRGWLADTTKRPHTRQMVLSIADKCKVVSLIPEIALLVADARAPQWLRDHAAMFLSQIVEGDQLAYLEPLARGEVGPDPRQNIKGSALRKLIPKRWKIREALPYLDAVNNHPPSGFYKLFVHYEMAAAIENEDVVPLLGWMLGHEYPDEDMLGANHLITTVTTRAATLLGNADVAAAVVEILLNWEWMQPIRQIIQRSLNLGAGPRMHKRETFLRALINHPDFNDKNGILLLGADLNQITTEDFEWLLNEIPNAPSERRRNWANTVSYLIREDLLADCWDKLVLTMRENDALRHKFDDLQAWELDGPQALKAKNRRNHLTYPVRETQPTKTSPDPEERIREMIRDIHEGVPGAWFQFWHRYSRSRIWESWEKRPSPEKEIYLTGARQFLIEIATSESGIIPGSNGADAARSALDLIRDSVLDDSELKAALSGASVRCLANKVYGDGSGNADQVIALLYQIDEYACIEGMLESLFEQFDISGMTSQSRHLGPYWNENLAERIRQRIEAIESPETRAKAINTIARANSAFTAAEARRFLDFQLQQPGATGMREALVAVLYYSASESFQGACEIMEGDEALEKLVWIDVLNDWQEERSTWSKALDIDELGQLYEILHRILPGPCEFPRNGDQMPPEHEARRQRDLIPKLIAERATEEASRELLRLEDILPDQELLLHHCFRICINSLRRNGWVPLAPQRTKEVLQWESARLLNGEDDLLELVLESLGRIQKLLTGQELPAASDLWSWTGAGNQRNDFRHKDEESLSDYLARELTRDIGTSSGVVVNREVQPVRGLRTDIHVTASHPGAEKFTVVIEVKGCWHREVKTALQTQLVADYLEGKLRCGIYLVGWFECAGWPQMDHKLASRTVDQARAEVAGFAADYRDGKNPLIRVEPFVMDCSI